METHTAKYHRNCIKYHQLFITSRNTVLEAVEEIASKYGGRGLNGSYYTFSHVYQPGTCEGLKQPKIPVFSIQGFLARILAFMDRT